MFLRLVFISALFLYFPFKSPFFDPSGANSVLRSQRLPRWKSAIRCSAFVFWGLEGDSHKKAPDDIIRRCLQRLCAWIAPREITCSAPCTAPGGACRSPGRPQRHGAVCTRLRSVSRQRRDPGRPRCLPGRSGRILARVSDPDRTDGGQNRR